METEEVKVYISSPTVILAYLLPLLLINPLTPELNYSAQRCLTRFFAADFAS
jgi:hypothetical protein